MQMDAGARGAREKPAICACIATATLFTLETSKQPAVDPLGRARGPRVRPRSALRARDFHRPSARAVGRAPPADQRQESATMKAPRLSAFAAAVAVVLLVGVAAPARAQWQVASKDGKNSIKFGFLAQPQFESLETTDSQHPTGDTVYAKNLFLRRFRILFGGQIAGNWTFFFETDSPNLGKQVAGTTAKDAGSIYLQDAFVTYNHGDPFKIDVGELLLGQDHNH